DEKTRRRPVDRRGDAVRFRRSHAPLRPGQGDAQRPPAPSVKPRSNDQDRRDEKGDPAHRRLALLPGCQRPSSVDRSLAVKAGKANPAPLPPVLQLGHPPHQHAASPPPLAHKTGVSISVHCPAPRRDTEITTLTVWSQNCVLPARRGANPAAV